MPQFPSVSAEVMRMGNGQYSNHLQQMLVLAIPNAMVFYGQERDELSHPQLRPVGDFLWEAGIKSSPPFALPPLQRTTPNM